MVRARRWFGVRPCFALAFGLACGGRTERLELESSGNRPPSDGNGGPGVPPALGGSSPAGAPNPASPPSAGQPPSAKPPPLTPPGVPVPPAPQPPDEPEPPAPVDLPDDPDLPDPVQPLDPPAPVVMDCGNPNQARVIAYEQSAIDVLAGCEELNGLRVYGPLDLRPLGSLRRVVGPAGVDLEQNTSLEGLEGLEETPRLSVTGGSVPDLRALSGLRRVGELELWNTRLIDLAGLEALRGVQSLDVQDNPVLESLRGLVLEGDMTELTFERNPALRDVSSLAGISGAGFVLIRHNPALTELPVFDQLVRLDGLLLYENITLQTGPQFPLLTSLNDLSIQQHPLLERLTGFAALETARYVWISGHDNLIELDLGQLRQSQTLLAILDNPRLDGAALSSSLAGVQTERLRVPADQSRPLLDPCPWNADAVCDEESFCALGSDPVCQ